MTNDTMTPKYILKPGKHQFAPGSAAIHCNNNTSDDEAAWYLEKYPHITSLFIQIPNVPELPGKRKLETSENKSSDSLENSGLADQ